MARVKNDGDAPTNGMASEGAMPVAEGEKPVKKRTPKNKTQAIKRALRRLGWDAKPGELQTWVWKHYRMEMDKSYISTIKSILSRQERAKEGSQPVSIPMPALIEDVPVNDPESVTIAELKLVKDLVARIGLKRFRDLAELFES